MNWQATEGEVYKQALFKPTRSWLFWNNGLSQWFGLAKIQWKIFWYNMYGLCFSNSKRTWFFFLRESFHFIFEMALWWYNGSMWILFFPSHSNIMETGIYSYLVEIKCICSAFILPDYSFIFLTMFLPCHYYSFISWEILCIRHMIILKNWNSKWKQACYYFIGRPGIRVSANQQRLCW